MFGLQGLQGLAPSARRQASARPLGPHARARLCAPVNTMARDRESVGGVNGGGEPLDLEEARRKLLSQFEPNQPSTSGRRAPKPAKPVDPASRIGWITPPKQGLKEGTGSTPPPALSAEAAPAAAAAASATAASSVKGAEPNLSEGWQYLPHHLSKQELWVKIREEAKADAVAEPLLASFLYSTILGHASLEKTMAFLLANKLAGTNPAPALGAVQIMSLLQEAYEDDHSIIESAVCDMLAVKDRDPACKKYTQALLYFKGYQAVQCHRVAHWLWTRGRKPMALLLQSRVSETLHVDIHPGAQLGRGMLMDHATGVIIGETAVVGDNVSMLHHVALGGSGLSKGVRHPIIGHGVLLGAGVTVLGPVVVGAGSKVGAGSVVVSDLPSRCVAVGVPARIIRRDMEKEPNQDMDQISEFIFDWVI